MKELKRAFRKSLAAAARETAEATGAKAGTGPIWTADTFARAGLERYATLFSFLSLPSEPDTRALNELALSLGLTVAAPRIHGETMGFYRIERADGPFAIGPYGIREPRPGAPALYLPPENRDLPTSPADAPIALKVPLLVAVPGLAFTRDGRRLGRGGGYYDRFLADLLASVQVPRDLVTLMGICPESRVLESLPTENHDIRVDCLLTEKDYIICGHLEKLG